MAKNLNPLAFGYASAIVSAAVMLLLGVLGNLGVYMNGFNAMKQWHIYFDLSVTGIIAGMIEAAVVGFGLVYVLVLLYNKLT